MSERLPGIAHGWEGHAWVQLQQIRSGVTPWTDAFAHDLARSLGTIALERSGPGQLFGFGGAATVAALASCFDPSFTPIAERVIARWAASEIGPEMDDLVLGHPGALVAIAEIAECRPNLRVPGSFVERCRDRSVAALDRILASERHLTGLAHGLAGLLLAYEQGAARLHARDDDLVARAFDRLAASRIEAPGIGIVWAPSTDGVSADITGSWCHGAAGVALALHTCFVLTQEVAYRELFDEVSTSIEQLPHTGPTFCCGRGGRVQVLIELYRQTGDPHWMDRARGLAAIPVAGSTSASYPDGFLQGALGLAYLELRLQHPSMPLPATGCTKSSARS